MKKHFMCTHAFFDNDAKQAFEDASIGMTDRQIFEMMKGEKAEMLGHWRGNDDFFFCHWLAETDEDIHNSLRENGLDELVFTACYEANIHIDTACLSDERAFQVRQTEQA